MGMETVAVGARGLAPPTDREPPRIIPWPHLNFLLATTIGSPRSRVEQQIIAVICHWIKWMVDETAGDGGRNGTGGDGGNADRRAVEFNLERGVIGVMQA